MGCTGDPALGVYGKLLLEDGASPYTWDADSIRLEILPDGGPAENIQKHGRFVGGQGIWGDVYPLASRVRDAGGFVYGQFRLNPSPAYLDQLMPYLVGTEVSGVFHPSNCLNDFGLLIYRDDHWDSTGWEIKDCKVASWELSGKGPEFREEGAPDLLTLRVNVIAKSENSSVGWPGTEPAFPEGEPFTPYLFQDSDSATGGEIAVNAISREVYAFNLRYDTGLRVKYPNSLTPKIYGTRRRITLQLALPWNDANDDLYDISYVGTTAHLLFKYSSYSTLFNIRNFKAPSQSPFVRDENEVFFVVEGQAYGTATEKEFSVTSTGDMSNTMSHTPSATPSPTPSFTPSSSPSTSPSRTPSATPST